MSFGAQSAFTESILVPSAPLPPSSDTITIRGPDFNSAHDLQSLLSSYATLGFQATGLAKGISIVDKMRKWRLSQEPIPADESELWTDPRVREETKCTIFLGYTSNIVSSGLREIIRFLVQHKHVSAIVTTAGGIEEDIIKCLGPTLLGDFKLDGATLRKQGMNRIGNLLVPNDNYCKFQEWLDPLLQKMLDEQSTQGKLWTPRRFIARLGEEINNEESIYYWAWKNDIPVFCPALTDGSIGDMIYFHSFRSPGLVLDIVADMKELNDLTFRAKKAGQIILGGGVTKHHINNAMLGRNGADYSVFINTAQEFDGSDSGASPDEAVSWGKIRGDAETVKICAEATIVFPLLVAATWGKDHWTAQDS
ncbi:Deoxyhypusine synthase [Atractiella rhizophila]|nr:Deoxyhypusine synthase [Atractiella rhizophila]